MVTLLLVSTWAALATTYIYDSNGRLAVVTNDAGESASYRYDELGNLVAIERLAVNDLAVIGFSPGRGATGVAVRINGHGFSPTAGQNTVRFNGTIASVSIASNTSLTAAVPIGATTGPITVTVGSETANSTTDFIVDENAQPPSITSVSPLIATAGTAITVSGQHMAPIVGQTATFLNQRLVVPTTLTNPQLVFSVPASTSSGRVRVMTPYGSALSAQDVLVTPSGHLPSAIAQVKRLTADAAAQGFSVTMTGHYGAALFDGAAGDYLSAQFSSISVASIWYELFGINNSLLAYGTASTSNPTFHLPRLPATGTYLLLMRPVSVPATWNLAIEKAPSIPVNGAQLEVMTTIAGQRKRFTFTKSPGQKNLGFGISDLITPGTTNYVSVETREMDGFYTLGTDICYAQNSGCQVNLKNLPVGVYQLTVIPPSSGSRTMSFKAVLSTDAEYELQRDIATIIDLPRRGQNGQLTFSGVTGETLGLELVAQSTVPTNRKVYYTAYKPDGSFFASTSLTWPGTLNLPNLPMTGAYTVLVDPEYGETLSAQAKLTAVSNSELQPDGASADFALMAPGQNVYLTFIADSGANLGLGISDLWTPGSFAPVSVEIFSPSGSTLMLYSGCRTQDDGCVLHLSNLEQGTYRVEVRPPQSVGMSFKATLSSEMTGALERGVPANLSLLRRGQGSRLTFAGTAGETLSLEVTGQSTTPANRAARYAAYRPDGSSWLWTNITSAGALNLPNLPVTGTYTFLVRPVYGETLSSQVILESVP